MAAVKNSAQTGVRARLERLLPVKPLARLRLAFLALAAALLAPLWALLNAAEERLEVQRRLRHEMVAERIFDELERELTSLLERESQRPSSAYDQHTSPASWAPFVVGYFTADTLGQHYVAEQEIGASRRAALDKAIGKWRSSTRFEPLPDSNVPRLLEGQGSNGEPTSPLGALQSSPWSQGAAAPSATPPEAAPPSPKSSPEVLRQLNRAQETRRPSPAKQRDPMMDYGY